MAQIALISGETLKDYSKLYDVGLKEATGQLVVQFNEPKRKDRAKRDREEGYSSDEEDVEIVQVVEKRPAQACARCGGRYENGDDGCFAHPGAFQLVLTEEEEVKLSNDANQVNPEYREPADMQVVSHKKWTCCGETNRFAPGCVQGAHKLLVPSSSSAPTSASQSLDSKLIAFFHSSQSMEPPRENVLPGIVNVAEGEAEDDDEVEIIGRDRLLGDANPQGTVSLTHIIAQNKSFALNEKSPHTLRVALGFAAGTHLESDCDAELILSVGWNTLMKLKLIRISATTNLLQAPSKVKLFVNKSSQIDFDNVNSFKADQEFSIDESSYTDGVCVLTLNSTKFTKVDTLTLYINSNIGDQPTTAIRNLGFVGIAPNIR